MVKENFFNIATPYKAVESANWPLKSAVGLRRNNPAEVEHIPNYYISNENVKPEYTLTFVGDIMPQGYNEVVISDEVKNYISGSDYLIGNFEGTIIAEKKVFPLIVSDLYHTKNIAETLSEVFPPGKTYLSVLNNYAGDFGKE